MLEDFVSYVHKEKFDLILCWNASFDFNYLSRRIKDFAKKISPINMQRLGVEEDIYYPAGISIIDYLKWFKKVFMREGSYQLEYIAQKRLGRPKKYSNKDVDFSKLSDTIKLRNIDDVSIMCELEEKYQIIPYFDEIRRLSKTQWEDLTFNCIDEKSEILTKKGWKNINNIDNNDNVLSLNLFNMYYEWQPIENIYKYDYEGQLISYNCRRINFAVTPNHKFPTLVFRHSGKLKQINTIEFECIKDIPEQRRQFILGSNGYKDGKVNYFSDEEIKLCAWIITEGHFAKKVKRPFGGEIYIYQSDEKHSQNKLEIREILINLNILYKETKNKFMIPTVFTSKYRVLLNEEKRIPKLFFDLPLKQLRLFIETLTKGDGHIKSFAKSGYICSADKVLAEQYQLICTLAGYNCYISSSITNEIMGTKLKKPATVYYANYYKGDCYCAGFSKNKFSYIDYKGKVWCISTPFHNFIMKREDKVMISGNSRIIEMLLFEEAKKQNIILPNKPKQDLEEETTFEGATRNLTATGLYKNVGEFDLASAYPSVIVNFCLDSKNIKETKEEGCIDINGIYFKQDPNTLLPLVVKPLLINKDVLKKQVKENPDDKTLAIKYDAIKGVVNSAFGVMGNQHFRMFDNKVASSITFLVRDLLMYVKEKIELDGLRVIYWDTDALQISTKENIVDRLNQYIKDWGLEKYGKSGITLTFDYKGYFDKLFLLGICHYYGILHGKKEPILKGIEGKRSNSSKYESYFQLELLNKIVNEGNNIEVEKWVQGELERIKTLPLETVAFPCKIANKVYVNVPVFKRALDTTQKINKKFKVSKGESFFYIYMQNKEVLAFTSEDKDFIDRSKIDWNFMIERSIFTKALKIFNAMKWALKKNILQNELF
jgi:DNA polymerase elongation subunit (family B)